jgi:hypothetical protein
LTTLDTVGAVVNSSRASSRVCSGPLTCRQNSSRNPLQLRPWGRWTADSKSAIKREEARLSPNIARNTAGSMPGTSPSTATWASFPNASADSTIDLTISCGL